MVFNSLKYSKNKSHFTIKKLGIRRAQHKNKNTHQAQKRKQSRAFGENVRNRKSLLKEKSLAKARPHIFRHLKCSQKTEQLRNEWSSSKCVLSVEVMQNNSSSPRSISIVQLNTLLCVHLRPIKLVVYKWPYSFKMMGYLILRCVSRLDTFSVYHDRTRLPGYALGRTTDAPEVRPTRSSRTKVSSSQISNAHDR